jgi:hypothetical protein
MRLILIAFILSVSASAAAAQGASDPGSAAHRSSRVSLAITAGFGSPRSKDALTHFWKGGPDLAMSLLVWAGPGFWLGTGADVSMLWFRQAAFAQAYPSVPLQPKDMAWVNVFVLARYGFIPSGRVHPYTELAIGASRLSGAEYKEVVDSVRVTYYDIPARTRLALTITGGLDIPVIRGLSFLAEVAVRYVHHDENVGVALLARGGVRVTL